MKNGIPNSAHKFTRRHPVICSLLSALAACGSLAGVGARAVEAQEKAEPKPETYAIDYDIRPLKGKLDKIPVLNSNSPEIVPGEGILLSTLDPFETGHPEAHLKYAVKGPFSIFFHHINKQEDKSARQVLTVSMLVFNPGFSKAILTFNSLASYVSQPDAPVYTIPPLVEDDQGKVYAGQGDRVVSDYVRGKADLAEPFTMSVAPRSYALVTELPIKVYGPVSTLNGRTYYACANASKPLQFALLATFARESAKENDEHGIWHPEGALDNMIALSREGTTGSVAGLHEKPSHERLTTLVKLCDQGGLAGPREGDKKLPTVPHSKQSIVYGRVSGVQIGANYTAARTITLEPQKTLALAYPISSVEQGTMGTGEVQAAPLLKRYPTSAYAAHGNYCVHYQVDLKLVNHCKQSRFVDIALSTPLKTDKRENKLSYYREENKRVFFRGVIKVSVADGSGKFTSPGHYYHLVSHRGEKLPPFAKYEMEAGTNKLVRIELFYTPDATPPQMLTVDSTAGERK
ncbi:MAG: DUF3370 domain-containing protein [Cyanobacteria bacterium SZAS LIN-3]|nr:DUF3370 domain-containing protein [Cyanobacteria bacterium SZAS LIN-3]